VAEIGRGLDHRRELEPPDWCWVSRPYRPVRRANAERSDADPTPEIEGNRTPHRETHMQQCVEA